MNSLRILGLVLLTVGAEAVADTLHRKDSTFEQGRLLDGGAERIRWSNPGWPEPWEVRTSFLESVVFVEPFPAFQGSWRMLTQAGDYLSVDLESADDTGYLVRSPIWGSKRIKRESVRFLERTDSLDRIIQAGSYRDWADLGPGPLLNLRYRIYDLDEGWELQEEVPKFSELKLVEEGSLPSGRIDFEVASFDRPRGVSFEGEVELQDITYRFALAEPGSREKTPRWARLTIGGEVKERDARDDPHHEGSGVVTSFLRNLSGKQTFRFEYLGEAPKVQIYPGLLPEKVKMPFSDRNNPFSLVENAFQPLSDWEEASDGKLTTLKEGASLIRRVDLPEYFELELEFFTRNFARNLPRFSFGFGPTLALGTSVAAFRLETWEDVLVVTRGDDFKVVRILENDDREVSLRLRYDGRARELMVYSSDGKLLVRWLGARIDTGISGVCLINKGQELTLGRFSLTQLDFATEPSSTARNRVRLVGGEELSGRLHHDANAGSWAVVSGSERREITLAKVDRVSHPPRENDRGAIRTLLSYGQNNAIGGRLLKIDEQSVTLATGWTEVPLICSREGLQQLLFSYSDRTRGSEFQAESLGSPFEVHRRHSENDSGIWSLLRTTNDFLRGKIKIHEDSGTLRWLPAGATASQAVGAQFTGRFEFDQVSPEFLSPDSLPPDRIWLYGDMSVPCRVLSCDENQVEIESRYLGRRTIAAQYLQAVELNRLFFTGEEPFTDNRMIWRDGPFSPPFFVNGVGRRDPAHPDTRWGKDQWIERIENALRLPRSLQDRLPTHLAIARNGDVLRGELIRVDGDSIRFRINEREVSFDRDRLPLIVRVVPPKKNAGESQIYIQTRSYMTLGFDGFGVGNGKVTFESDVLGRCSIPLEDLWYFASGDFRAEESFSHFDAWEIRSSAEE